jgi:hypothetical protein
VTEFPELSNSYRDPEPEPSFAEDLAVWAVWDDSDYYGPDPAPEPWLFDDRDAAKARVNELTRRNPGEWQESDGVWERAGYRVQQETIYRAATIHHFPDKQA